MLRAASSSTTSRRRTLTALARGALGAALNLVLTTGVMAQGPDARLAELDRRLGDVRARAEELRREMDALAAELRALREAPPASASGPTAVAPETDTGLDAFHGEVVRPDLAEDERYAAFDALQRGMSDVWAAMRLDHADESVVVVPSVSLEHTTATTGTLVQAMEERALFLLLLLRQPRLRMVYVTSSPVPEAIIAAVRVLAGAGNSEALNPTAGPSALADNQCRTRHIARANAPGTPPCVCRTRVGQKARQIPSGRFPSPRIQSVH